MFWHGRLWFGLILGGTAFQLLLATGVHAIYGPAYGGFVGVLMILATFPPLVGVAGLLISTVLPRLRKRSESN